MNLRRFGYVLISLVVLGGFFYLGFLYGYRQYFNEQPDEIQVIASNQAQRNSLSDIQVKEIWGAVSNKKSAGFGELYFKASEGRTELLVRLRNVPLKAAGENNEIGIPASLKVETASLTEDGLDYNYNEIGTISLDEPQNNKRSGEFATILNYSIFEVDRKIDRIVITAESDEIENFFLDEDPNLPAQVRREPAPFFWVVL